VFKEYQLPKESFIGGWFIPNNICDNLISYFKKNKNKTVKGSFFVNSKRCYGKKIKDSTDLGLLNNVDKEVMDYKIALQTVLDLYVKKYPEVNTYDRFNIEDIIIQHYPKKGGYKVWHFERVSKLNVHRVLVFMTYLNNIKKGGTCFKYQKTTTPSKKGLTLIWPSDFTHTHKGQITNEEKTIITGWFAFI
jgi:prolyl 4-hydroxylase